MKMKLLVSMVFVLVLVSGSFAFGVRGGMMGEKRLETLSKAIGLTDQQKNKILSEEKKIAGEAKELAAKNRQIFSEIEKEMVKESPDNKVILNALNQISQNRVQLQYKRIEQMVQLRKELTPEQREKFEKMLKERKEMMKKITGKWNNRFKK